MLLKFFKQVKSEKQLAKEKVKSYPKDILPDLTESLSVTVTVKAEFLIATASVDVIMIFGSQLQISYSTSLVDHAFHLIQVVSSYH